MPKVHSVGPLFVQILDLPVEWGNKVCVRGWTQEIEKPFRTATPILVRLPRYKALAFGKWTGRKSEEEALNTALQRRDVTYDDFTQEAGWTDPDSYRETGSESLDTGPNRVDRDLDVHHRKASESMDKISGSR